MKPTACLLFALALVLVVPSIGCEPVGVTGPSGPGSTLLGDDRTNPPPDLPDDPPLEPPAYTFSISASPIDPYFNEGPAEAGAYDLYLWLVCTSRGLSHLEVDLDVSGDALVEDHYFSPLGNDVVSIDWEQYGELNLAVQGCPTIPTLLGAIHMIGSGDGGRICLSTEAEGAGAHGCYEPSAVHELSCVGFASDGSLPCVTNTTSGCAPPRFAHTFAISASRTDPYVNTGEPRDEPYLLYLWRIVGNFSALQGDITDLGGDEAFDPVFGAEPPFINLTYEGGPDVMMAAPGCPGGPSLLGSILIEGHGEDVYVTMTQGADGGLATCEAAPRLMPFGCRPYRTDGR